MSDTSTRAAIAAAEKVAALPTVVERALETIYDSRSDARELAGIIGLDPALTGKILKLVNSPYYNTLPRRVVSLTEAILRLGYRTVQSALLTTEIANQLRPPLPHYGLQRKQFWHHCVAVALCAREIARRSRLGHPEEAYVAGLLHDIGKVGMDRAYAGTSEVRRLVRERKLPYHEAEMIELSVDHATVGELVANRWGLPPATGEAIGAHHRLESKPGALVATVSTANALGWMLGFPGTDDEVPREVDDYALASLGMRSGEVEKLAAGLLPVVDDALGLLSSDDEP